MATTQSSTMPLVLLGALIVLIVTSSIYRGTVYVYCIYPFTSILVQLLQNDNLSAFRIPTLSPITRKTKEVMLPLPRTISGASHPLFSFLFSNILPNRAASRCMKPLTHKVIPVRWRHFLLKRVFGSVYAVRWGDFKQDLAEYQTFHDFFTRKLMVKRNLAQSDLVSPVDGTVISFGEMDESQTVEQVKGVRFSLKQFLYGYDTEFVNEKMMDLQRDIAPQNKLFFTILYLNPGDYHRFHSPADGIKIDCVNHIVGDLYPVKPSYLKAVPGLFALNERIVLSGNWKEDLFFGYVPVGAFNIGSIHLRDDPYHLTNQMGHDSEVWYRTRHRAQGLIVDDGDDGGDDSGDDGGLKVDETANGKSVCDEKVDGPSPTKCISVFKPGQELLYNKGSEIGHFSFGSTVVLVFEAPRFEFYVRRGQKVQFGQPLGDITPRE